MHSKSTITRDQFVKAVVPFMEALGLDAKAIFTTGFTLTENKIEGLTAGRPTDAEESSSVTVGDVPDYSEKGWPFVVEVVD